MIRAAALIAAAATLAAPGLASAQVSDRDSKTVGIVGTVPAQCFGGTLSGDGSFDLGLVRLSLLARTATHQTGFRHTPRTQGSIRQRLPRERCAWCFERRGDAAG